MFKGIQCGIPHRFISKLLHFVGAVFGQPIRVVGRESLNQISVRGVCSTVHDGGLHPAPCLRYTVGT